MMTKPDSCLNSLTLFRAVSVLVLLLLASATAAQQTLDQIQGGIGSRIRKSDDESNTFTIENSISTNLTIPEVQIIPCQASVSLAYYQKNTLARVVTEIENKYCKVGNGSLEIVATIRDENAVTSALTFPETWQQQEGELKLEFIREYPIGENMDLVRVRSTRVKCECLETTDDSELNSD